MNADHVKVLQLNIAGQPQCWLTREKAATLAVKGLVAWSASTTELMLTGGTSRITGERSVVSFNSIIAIRGAITKHTTHDRIELTNKSLFARDKYICAYCGDQFLKKPTTTLSRDHVIPTSRGGEDTWTNVVTACIPCNHKKANKLVDGDKLKLLYVPYMPCKSEALLLSNRNVLADQLEFLMLSIKKGKQHN